jgi:ribosomal protein L40E
VSGVLSIFQKVCPSCAAHIAVDAANCACGHEFEAMGGNNSASADEQALRDEELYENYLAARAGQAAEAARAAAEWLAAEPGNSDRANAAQLAQEVASSLEADLNEQRAKISAMRRALGPRLMSTPPAKPAAVAAPKPAKQQAAAKPAAPAQPAAKPHVSAAQATPKPAPAPAKPAPSPAPAVSAGATLPSMSSPYKATAALEAIKRAKAQEAVAATPAPTVTATPPDSFRAEQAARASRAIAEQAKPVNSKDCPNCTAAVPLATTRCRCGYTFVSGTNDLPTLTLCTGDFTALRNSLKLNLGK